MKKLLTVEAAFAVEGRGTILAPEIELGPRASYALTVELRRPDGTRESCAAKASVPMVNPPVLDRVPAHVLIVEVQKERIPIGTEVWLIADEL